VTGRMMNDWLGRIHFAGSLVCINVIFMPMFVQGLAGMNRRLYDGGMTFAHARDVFGLNVAMSHAAWGLALFQIVFLINFFGSRWFGRRATENPWEATTLEWTATATPPLAHGNFAVPPFVYRTPYEYSVPGAPSDFTPQNEAP
jgi:cytochrome c oxidase subunit 1